MKRSEFTDKWSRRFFEKIVAADNTKDKQLVEFFHWCLDNGFFNNASEEYIRDFVEESLPNSLLLRGTNGITVGVDIWKDDNPIYDHVYIGIDPTECFVKISKCSINMKLPITSKREKERFYDTLDELMDRKSARSREWFGNAPTMWYGSYLTNWR